MIFTPQFSEEDRPLPEYPRPQFARDSYLSLNGLWDYSFSGDEQPPEKYHGKILVPYSPESALSGVNRQLKADEFLHYRTTFRLPEGFNKGRIIINFGACDQRCAVFVNGVRAGGHEGGYLPFSFDITPLLVSGDNQLAVTVADDASSHIYGRGKQSYEAKGIWYTAISGIWQSVWLESVPEIYLSGLRITPDAERGRLKLSCKVSGGEKAVSYAIYDGQSLIASATDVPADAECEIDVSGCKRWSPDDPQLYKIIILCGEDRVESYFGLRSFGTAYVGGKRYFTLNGEPIFHSGLLDQGYWGEGIYTPASNREMYECIRKVKALGFNMLRKHIKTEPMLWYYYCDISGVLVWQDMPNGGAPYSKLRINLGPFINLHLNDKNYASMGRDDSRSRAQYLAEAEGTADVLYNCVSVCLWTLFNEGWGQFDSADMYEIFRKKDPTRPIDHASGWQDKGSGDLNSRHIYFKKVRLKNDCRRVLALTEFGGYSFRDNADKKAFSYRTFATKEEFLAALERLYSDQIIPCIAREGLCATVYTQLCDVEHEVNGIFTADWRCKADEGALRRINDSLYAAFAEATGRK